LKIRMVQERTGGRHDGRAWPPVGGELYVEDEEGAAVCAAGWAIPVPEDTPVELRATGKATEEARGAESPAEAPEGAGTIQSPAQNAPKAAWVAYAAARGMPEDEAAAMSKADLIAALG
jgi:hypothetical protein